MRPQTWFPHLSPSLVSEPATTMAVVSATTPSAGSATARAEVSATTPAAESAEVPAPSSAKVSVSDPPAVPAAVSVAAPAERSTTASIWSVQALEPPPESRIAVRDKRLSVSRVVSAVTVEVAGRAVTYQEVGLVSLSKSECATASPKPAAAVLVMTATAVLARWWLHRPLSFHRRRMVQRNRLCGALQCGRRRSFRRSTCGRQGSLRRRS